MNWKDDYADWKVKRKKEMEHYQNLVKSGASQEERLKHLESMYEDGCKAMREMVNSED